MVDLSLKKCGKGLGIDEKPKKLCVLMKEKYKDLMVYEEKDPEKLKQGDYKFGITSGAFNVTAFRTKQGLDRWLNDTGVRVGKQVSHLHNAKRLKGSYERISLAGDKKQLDKFCRDKKLHSSKILSNAEYTKSCVKVDKKGNKIFYLNPNYDREEFEYIHE